MKEPIKTGIFAAIAAVTTLIALVSRPTIDPIRAVDKVNSLLFEEFKDPSAAASLEVVKYLKDVDKVSSFKVAKDKATGRWLIPSNSDYPADATEQMKEVGTLFLGLKALGVASEVSEDHKLFGVVSPDKAKAGGEGVGTRVTIRDDSGKELVKLVIGFKVKGTNDQHFVRIEGQDPVYAATITPDKLSTKFEDWIEKDLLKINTLDVERLLIKDYSVVRTNQGFVLEPRMDLSTAYTATDSKWNLSTFTTYKQGKASNNQLMEDEELNRTRLDELKNALRDIKIVDVARKPKGLRADLNAGGEFLNNRDNVESLVTRGFYPVQSSADSGEIRSANGEIHVGMKDGYDYILRFGNVAGSEEGKAGSLTRYLFVMARLDESKFPEPMLEPLPDLPADVPSKPETKSDKGSESKGDGGCDDTEKAGADKPDSAKADPAKDDSAKADPAKEDSAKADEKETPAKEGEKKDDSSKPDAAKADAPKADGAKPDGAKPDGAKPDGAKPDGAKPDGAKPDGAKPDGAKPDGAKADGAKSADERDEKIAKIKAERDRIEKENQRKLDDHRDKRKKAQDKVRELNGRFADWYYVISEDVYKKIHVGRSDIIKDRENAKDEGFGVDAFRKMEKEGIKPPPKPAPTANPSFGIPGA